MIQRPPACQRHADQLIGQILIVDESECPWCWAEERVLAEAEDES